MMAAAEGMFLFLSLLTTFLGSFPRRRDYKKTLTVRRRRQRRRPPTNDVSSNVHQMVQFGRVSRRTVERRSTKVADF